MTNPKHKEEKPMPFHIGSYRPIYLWGGPGTIRMNKIKFMDYPVDEAVHRAVHSEPVAHQVRDQIHANWVHLMYDWGFPPEAEQEDWEDFRKAAAVYHAAGTPIFAYIQTSNCVFEGSFTEKDWYVQDPKGRKVYYYSGRYMVDWTHPDWIQHLKDLIRGSMARGADGIFFDNLWYGQQPSSLMGGWLGGAGCYCARCQALYRQESGQPIPEKILPERPEVAHYLRWRAEQVTTTLQELADMIHTLKPDAPISANDYDVTMRNSLLIYGIDVEALARIQDVIMVENFALPRWDQEPHPRLANNALTIRNTREFVRGQAHLSVLSYDVGIGFDPVYPPRRHQQGIAEAAACGASMTIKGTEYNDGEKMTLLTDPAYAVQQEAIGNLNRWLEDHQELYQNRTNAAPVALLHPEEDLWRHWHALAPVYHGAGQVLTWAGIPWRVLRKGDPTEGIKAVLHFGKEKPDIADPNLNLIHVPDLAGWAWGKPSAVARGSFWHSLATGTSTFLLRSYHGSKFARRLMDRMHMARIVTQTSLFNLPQPPARDALLQALPEGLFPRAAAEHPVLIEVWARNGQRQIHLVNYASQPQEVTLTFAAPVSARWISPDAAGEEKSLQGRTLTFPVDIYSILNLA
jgi:hypothetical protein